MDILKTMGAVAGIGGLALGVFLILFRDFLRKLLLPKLGKEQAYRLLRLFLVLVWSIAVIGIAAWVVLEFRPKEPTVVQVPEGCLPKQTNRAGLVLLETVTECPVASAKQKALLAQKNVDATISYLQSVGRVNEVIVMPAMKEFITEPTEPRWKTLLLQVKHIAQAIDKATQSISSLDPESAAKMGPELTDLSSLLRGRSALIFELKETPMTVEQATQWSEQYKGLVNRLNENLVTIRGKMTAIQS